MSIKFSASTGGFYDDTINPVIPSDAIEISAEAHRQLLDAQSSGLIIQPGTDGYPEAVEPPPPTTEQLANAARIERDRLLSACDWTSLPDAPLDAAARSDWTSYRQALRDVPAQIGFPDNFAWPSLPQVAAS